MTHCHQSCIAQHLKRVWKKLFCVDVTSVREFVAVLRNAISGVISNLSSFTHSDSPAVTWTESDGL